MYERSHPQEECSSGREHLLSQPLQKLRQFGLRKSGRVEPDKSTSCDLFDKIISKPNSSTPSGRDLSWPFPAPSGRPTTNVVPTPEAPTANCESKNPSELFISSPSHEAPHDGLGNNSACTSAQPVSRTQKRQKFTPPKPFEGYLRYPSPTELNRTGSKRINRTFTLPTSYDTIDDYVTLMRRAISEIIQIQITTMAARHAKIRTQTRERVSDAKNSTVRQLDVSSFRKAGIPVYFGCSLQRGVGEKDSSLGITLTNREHHAAFSKGDIWALSLSMSFDSAILVKSTFFGPRSNGVLESNAWNAIRLCNASSELMMIENLELLKSERSDNSIIPWILNYNRAATLFSEALSPRSSLFGCIHNRRAELWNIFEDHMSEFSLNENQRSVLERFTSSLCFEASPITLVHGVFGAGKSYLACILILLLHRFHQAGLLKWNSDVNYQEPSGDFKVVISSMTNVAVDRIMMGLIKLQFTSLVRVGSLKKIAKPVLPYVVQTSANGSEEMEQLKSMRSDPDISPAEEADIQRAIENLRARSSATAVQEAFVIGVTCAATTFVSIRDINAGVLILDECSQMPEPISMLPIVRFNSQKIVMIGDPLQLGPILTSTPQSGGGNGMANGGWGLERTLFERTAEAGLKPIFLRTQYRCHPYISRMANVLFYGGVLSDGFNCEENPQPFDQIAPACFVNVPNAREVQDMSKSFTNPAEAQWTVRVISAILERGIPSNDIGVISLYKGQAELISNELRKLNAKGGTVEVSSVDAFQGAERSIILISTVRTDSIGFIDDPRRINVALTRAQNHLIILGSMRLLQSNPLWESIIQYCGEIAGFTSPEKLLEDVQTHEVFDFAQPTNCESQTNEEEFSKCRVGKQREDGSQQTEEDSTKMLEVDEGFPEVVQTNLFDVFDNFDYSVNQSHRHGQTSQSLSIRAKESVSFQELTGSCTNEEHTDSLILDCDETGKDTQAYQPLSVCRVLGDAEHMLLESTLLDAEHFANKALYAATSCEPGEEPDSNIPAVSMPLHVCSADPKVKALVPGSQQEDWDALEWAFD
ncbi:AAA domain-containing protein [Cladochytrium replicatum]|nr:AAA domain-containing protein [Cladochytrium replicatum]